MPVEHVVFGAQGTTLDTWVLPTMAFQVDSFKVDPARARFDGRLSGVGRGLAGRWLAGKAPAGSLSMPLWSDGGMGIFLLAAGLLSVTDTTPGGAVTAKEHAFLPDDSAAWEYLTAQAQYDAATGQNVLGMAIDTLTLTASVDELVMLAADWVAKDEALCGGTWDHDGSASAALIANPVYPSATIKPYRFFEGTVSKGGAVTLDPVTKQLAVAAGTALAYIDSIEIALSNSIDARRFVTTDPTPVRMVPQNREITVKLDVDQSTVTTDFYAEMRAGTPLAIQLKFVGDEIEAGHNREFTLTLPLVDFDNAPFADIQGSQDRRVRSAEGTALVDSTTTTDIGIMIRDSIASY